MHVPIGSLRILQNFQTKSEQAREHQAMCNLLKKLTNHCFIHVSIHYKFMLFYIVCRLLLTSGYKQNIKTSPDNDFIGNKRHSNICLHTVVLHLWVIDIR